MKRSTKNRLIIILCMLLAAVSLWLGMKYASFRSETNYKFASVADFFHQLFARNKVDFEFIDQNIDERAIGEYRLRTMKVRLSDGEYVVRAVAVDSALGTYYRFPTFDFDTGRVKFGVNDTSESVCIDMYALFLDDGTLIEVLSDYPVTDNYGGPAITIEDEGSYYKDYAYEYYFWIPHDLPADYLITCEEENFFDFTYDEIIEGQADP